MRVIAGSARGIRLKAVPGEGTRPITDRAKEALFSILGAETVDARFLDLFAGTGSVGIEALSRGAASATFVEKNPKALSTIRENLRRTRLGSYGRVVRADVFKYLGRDPQCFDVIYVAPPQYLGLANQTVQALDAEPGWLAPETLVVVQVFPKEYQSLPLTTLQLTDQRTYGSTLLSFYRANL
jgi:16S rRNA (guanine(966)-N(2))-methyltransferase RsmD